MQYLISEESLIQSIVQEDDLELHSWSDDADTELLFKLKGLREYFLTNPRKDFSTLTIDCLLVDLPLDDDFRLHINVELDLFVQYHAPSDDISISISQDAYRITGIEVLDMDSGDFVEVEVMEGLKEVREFAKNNADLSKELFNRIESQPYFDKVDMISTCLRHLTPTGKPLTQRYMDEFFDQEIDAELEAMKKKKTPTLVE